MHCLELKICCFVLSISEPQALVFEAFEIQLCAESTVIFCVNNVQTFIQGVLSFTRLWLIHVLEK